MPELNLRIRPRIAGLFFLGASLTLAGIHFGAQFIRYVFGRDSMFGLTQLFDLWAENTIPAWYASSSLLLCGMLLFLIAWATKKSGMAGAAMWTGLACLFVFVSLDEMISLHERLMRPLRAEFGLTGPLFFAWVVPYGLAMIALGAVYFRFIWRLPGRTRTLFISAAAVFLGGAVGMEMIGGVVYEAGNYERTLPIEITNFLEETMEMIGVAIFIFALCDYLSSQFGHIRVSFSDATEQ